MQQRKGNATEERERKRGKGTQKRKERNKSYKERKKGYGSQKRNIGSKISSNIYCLHH